MLEIVNSLSWQAAFAIVGSVVTIVVGLFGYLRNKTPQTPPAPKLPQQPLYVSRTEFEQLHARVSSAKEIAAENKGELHVLSNLVKTIEKQIADHERRDIQDFKVMQQKIDRIMDIVIQILQDDKL